jgi:hypothetical protein
MNTIQLVLLAAGLALLAGGTALVYCLLPPAMLESASQQGRYAGLGGRGFSRDLPRGRGEARYGSPLGHHA